MSYDAEPMIDSADDASEQAELAHPLDDDLEEGTLALKIKRAD